MSAGKFRLQSVWKLRTAQRDQRRSELAEAYQAQQLLDQQARQLAAERDQTRDQARRACAAGQVNVDQVLQAQRYELLLQAQSQLLQQQSTQVAAETERRRQALVAADQQVRTLEKLRQRDQQQQQQREQQQEIRHLDEVAQRCRKPENECP